MSQNCKSTSYPSTRDANNNTLYHGGGAAPDYHNRAYPPSYATSTGYQQMAANVIFGGMTGMNELKMKESAEKEARRTH